MALPCKQIQTEFSALLDDELDQEDRELVEEHLSECADCLRELHSFKQVSDAYFYHHPAKAPDDFEERLRKALAPQLTPLRPAWSTWRVAAAAMILLGSGLSIWHMAARNTDEVQLSKNMSETAGEAVASTPAPASPEMMGTETDLGRSLRDNGGSDVMDFHASKPMAEKETMRSAAGAAPRKALESAPMAKKEAPSALAVPTRLRREGDVDKLRITPQSQSPAAPPMEERIAVAAKTAPADAAPSPALESVVMEDDTAADEIASGLLEVKARSPRKALAAVEEAPVPPPQWRKRSFMLQNGTLQQADYNNETLKDVAIPSDAWTALLDRFPDLTQLIDGTRKVIVKLDKTWYQIAVVGRD